MNPLARATAYVVVGVIGGLSCTAASAQQVSARLSLQAQASVLGQATWFRAGGDNECGWWRPASRDESMGTIQLTRNLDVVHDANSPALNEQLELAHHWKGHTFVARRISVALRLLQEDGSDRFTFTINDFLNQERLGFDDGGKCGHTAGSMRLSSDRVHGRLLLTVLPKGPARAIAVSFKRRSGIFHRASLAIDGVLHPIIGSRADDLILWVKTGESPTLSYEFDEAYGGLQAGATGTEIDLTIRSLGANIPPASTLKSTLAGLPRRGAAQPPNMTQVVTAIDVLLGSVNSAPAVRSILSETPWDQLFALTDELFRFEVWPLPGTLEITRDLKVAARLFGFSLGKALLQDLLTGCDGATVRWPDGTTVTSSRVYVIDGLLELAGALLAEYPTATLPAEAEGLLKAYYANHPRGFETAVEAITQAKSVSKAATLDRVLMDTERVLQRAAGNERQVRLGLDASTNAAATIGTSEMAAAVESREAALVAIRDARRLLSAESSSGQNYAIRLFTTDAHLVRLVVGDVDPYLEKVRDAFLQDGELAAEFGIVDECIKGGG